uniref:LMBR1-like membrane protein n=1 Tax=Kalanchoe fedtschenkoi TaxID=63787 RepID=A0A7N0VCL1_KALFE
MTRAFMISKHFEICWDYLVSEFRDFYKMRMRRMTLCLLLWKDSDAPRCWSDLFLVGLVILEYVLTDLGYEDAGDFTFTERLKTSIRENLIFYLVVGSIGLFGIILLATLGKIGDRDGGILGFAMGCSNTFGLVTGAFLLGFGLSEIPKGIWRNADWTTRQKVLSHKIAKLALKLDDAHQDFSNAIVVAQATSNQMSKRDPLRPYMNIIDQMLDQMLKEDPTFKPQGGRLGENDMDYDTDEKSMAALRRQLRIAREEYYRYRSEYTNYVMKALELEDTVKNYDRRDATGWKYISSFRPERKGSVGSALDTVEFIWRCILRKQLAKVVAILLGCMSAAILLAEATILPSHFDLSLFSLIIKAARKQEVSLQVVVLIPLMYMCICTYYSLLKIGMMMFYALTPRQTSSVSLLMICSMVARYAPPISYNFLNLVHLDNNAKTIFEQRMGNIDSAVAVFGKGFNKIYPLIMVTYTLLVAFNVFDRVINYFGNWKIFKFQNEADDTDGFDPSGMIILQKERSGLEQGRKVGELVIPLARNFNNTALDIESGSASANKDKAAVEMKATTSLIGGPKRSPSLLANAKHETSREAMAKKYAAIRDQQFNQAPNGTLSKQNSAPSSLEPDNPQSQNPATGPSGSGIASTWASMKTSLLNVKASIEAKRFIPLRQAQDTKLERRDSSESLDEIFQKLKKPTPERRDFSDDEADGF